MSKEKIIVTSALPYANGPIHFGHIAGAYLPADIYVRYKRLTGADTIFICGTDEHGVAITLSAEKEGVGYQEWVDKWHANQKEFFNNIDIKFDYFGRTSQKEHKKLAQQFFLDLYENGYIKKNTTDQHKCDEHGYLADRYLAGKCPYCEHTPARGDECPSCGRWLNATDLTDVTCSMCGKETKLVPTTHWFLQLQDLSPKLKKWLESQKHWRKSVSSFVLSMIEEGLKERAITRDLPWGVPVPLDDAEGKVLYVWFDAPIGYISITQEWAEEGGKEYLCNQYWQDKDAKVFHYIGKDNVPFHAIVWPAMLMGQNQPYVLPYNVVGNQFFNLEGKQFSKSEGWYIDTDEFFKKYDVNSLRYYLTRVLPETADSHWYWKDFQATQNNELADNFGNLVNRCLSFITKNFDGVVPTSKGSNKDILSAIDNAFKRVGELLENQEMRSAVSAMMDLAREGNKYFNDSAPWTARKEDPDKCAETLHTCIQLFYALAIVSYPFIPNAAEKLWKMCNFPGEVSDATWPPKEIPSFGGHKLGKPEVLFKKIEDDQIEEELAKLKK